MSDTTLAPKDFQYVDIAVGNWWNRNRIVNIREIRDIMSTELSGNALYHKEVYVTAYRYTPDIYEWLKTHKNKNGNPSVVGYNGVHFSPFVYIDVDQSATRMAPAQVLEDARTIIRTLVERWGINPKWMRYYFSGSKGFHIELRSVWMNLVPKTTFAKEVGVFMKHLADGVEIDSTIYEPVRLFRAPRTVNIKSFKKKVPPAELSEEERVKHKNGRWDPVEGKVPLFKVPLHYDEIMYGSVEEIVELAKTPRNDFKDDLTYKDGEGQVIERLARAFNDVQVGQNKVQSKPKGKMIPGTLALKHVPRDEKVCIHHILHEGLPFGERDGGMLVLIDYFARSKGFPNYVTSGIMYEFWQNKISHENDPPTWDQVEGMIERIYNGSPYDYGCNNEIMARRCCKSSACKYWKGGTDADRLEDHLFTIAEAGFRYGDLMQNATGHKITIGYPAIDTVMGGGALPGQVIFIAARSGVGKTTWLLNILRNIAKNHENPHTLFFSLEQPVEEVFEKMAAQIDGVVSTRHVEHEFTKNSQYAQDILRRMEADLPHLRFCDIDRLTLDQMKEIIEVAKKKYNVDHFPVIAVDYLGRMSGRGKDEYHVVSELAKNMKQLAKDLNCVVFVIHQCNREGGGSGDKKLTMTSLRGSGQAEEAADFILAISREDMEGESTRRVTQYRTCVQLLKNRRGESNFEYSLIYDGSKALFLDVTDGRESYTPDDIFPDKLMPLDETLPPIPAMAAMLEAAPALHPAHGDPSRVNLVAVARQEAQKTTTPKTEAPKPPTERLSEKDLLPSALLLPKPTVGLSFIGDDAPVVAEPVDTTVRTGDNNEDTGLSLEPPADEPSLFDTGFGESSLDDI